MIDDIYIRKLIAAIASIVLDELAAKHYNRLTQEPPLTARAGQRLEDLTIKLPPGYELTILTQDLPDHGTGSLERPTGTDLYVGIAVTIRGLRKTKGLLVQSKWDHAARDKTLERQCRRMLDITEDAYVWIYGPTGIEVEHARDVLRERTSRPRRRTPPRHADELFDGVLSCEEGDRRIGLPDGPDVEQALSDMIGKIGADAGIALVVSDE